MVKTYGYIRVSTREQNEARQLAALRGGGNPGPKHLSRQAVRQGLQPPKLSKLLRKLKKDDLLYVKSIDRLGRNYEEIQAQWRLLTKEKRGGHRGAGYASSGHPARQGFDGHLPGRCCAPGAVLCGGERARQHPPAAGRRHRGGQGQGSALRPPAPTPCRRTSPASRPCKTTAWPTRKWLCFRSGTLRKTGTPRRSPCAYGSHRKVWWRCARGTGGRPRFTPARARAAAAPTARGGGASPGRGKPIWRPSIPSWPPSGTPTKNGDLTPAEVLPGSHRKVWWRCDRGHVWQADINSRVKGSGCPVCPTAGWHRGE